MCERDIFPLYVKNLLGNTFDNGNHVRLMTVYCLMVYNRLDKKNFLKVKLLYTLEYNSFNKDYVQIFLFVRIL